MDRDDHGRSWPLFCFFSDLNQMSNLSMRKGSAHCQARNEKGLLSMRKRVDWIMNDFPGRFHFLSIGDQRAIVIDFVSANVRCEC